MYLLSGIRSFPRFRRGCPSKCPTCSKINDIHFKINAIHCSSKFNDTHCFEKNQSISSHAIAKCWVLQSATQPSATVQARRGGLQGPCSTWAHGPYHTHTSFLTLSHTHTLSLWSCRSLRFSVSQHSSTTRPSVERTADKAFLLSDRVYLSSAEVRAEGTVGGSVGVVEIVQCAAVRQARSGDTAFDLRQTPHSQTSVDVRLLGKGNSSSRGARLLHLIITTMYWIRTSRL